MFKKQIISNHDILELLNDFNLGKIVKINQVKTSGNFAYLIISSKGKFFLRLSPFGPRWRSEKEILAEIELLEYLRKNDFPVFPLICDRNKEFLISWKKHFGYIRIYGEGRAKLNPNNSDIKKLGVCLGRFHNLIENYQTRYKREHIWDLQKTKKNFLLNKKFILISNFENKEKFVLKIEKELSSISFPGILPSGMIHEDLGKRHVIWKDNEIEGFLDFDRAYYGRLVLDLGQACRGWCFSNNWRKWNNKKFKTLISGYEEERKITKVEKEYLFNAIRFAILERSISFCMRYIEATRDKEDEKFAWHSISESGLLGLLNRDKEKIKNILELN